LETYFGNTRLFWKIIRYIYSGSHILLCGDMILKNEEYSKKGVPQKIDEKNDILASRMSRVQNQRLQKEEILKLNENAKARTEIIDLPMEVDETCAVNWLMRLANSCSEYRGERSVIKKEIDTIEDRFKGSKLQKRIEQYLGKIFNRVEAEFLLLQAKKNKLELELDELDEKKELKLKDYLSSSDSKGWLNKGWEIIKKYAPKIAVPIISAFATLKTGDAVIKVKEMFQSMFGNSGEIILAGSGMMVGFLIMEIIETWIKSSRIDKIFKESTERKKEILEEEDRLLELAKGRVRVEVLNLKKMYFPEVVAQEKKDVVTETTAQVETTQMVVAAQTVLQTEETSKTSDASNPGNSKESGSEPGPTQSTESN
jgi:hypothetical protein